MGIRFTILTDHAALTYLTTKATLSRRQARYLDTLSEYNFEILHVAGKLNVADYLTRIPDAYLLPNTSYAGTATINNTGTNISTLSHPKVRFADSVGLPLETKHMFCKSSSSVFGCTCGRCNLSVSLCLT